MSFSDYIETYIERDISQIINIKDKFTFRMFVELLASLTGQELIYDNISNSICIDIITVKSLISVLMAGDIVSLLEPYHEISIKKRGIKSTKIYFLILVLLHILQELILQQCFKLVFLMEVL